MHNYDNKFPMNDKTHRKIIKQKIKEITLFRFILKLKQNIESKLLQKKRFRNISKIRDFIDNDTTIISSNCFAGRILQDLGMEYNTPTLGLYFMYPDYIHFLSNLEYYLKDAKIKFTDKSKYSIGNERRNSWSHWYPIGLLDNEIEIHFLHYHSEKEAAEKWYRRAKRVNFNKLIIIGMEQNLCTLEDIQRFDKLPYKYKYIFTTKNLPNLMSNIYMEDFIKDQEVGDPYKKGHIFYKYLSEKLS